jgi:hypothetical protein
MKVRVTIAGVTPLLMNRFTEHSEVSISSGTSPVLRGDKGTPREQAERKRYADEQGNLYIPGPNIFSCIIDAGRFHKAGKRQLTSKKESMIPAGVSIPDIVCLIVGSQWEVDSRSVVNPSTGGRIMCYRPRIDKWSTTFTLDIDEQVFSPDLVRVVVDDAGKKIGLGDFRPVRKGPFGKFVVTNWQVVEAGLPAAA